MALTQKLNEEWERGETSRAVFAIRAAIQHVRSTIAEENVRIAEIVASGAFAAIDPEIKAEGQACIQIIQQASNALFEDHTEFLDWTKSED